MKMQFSGHESFVCKHLWLRKGYDYVINNKSFNDEAAVIELGVGKNMVSSISYWLKAFGIVDGQDELSVGDFLFNRVNGKDPFIESIASIWLLHYSLIKTNKASIYSLFFNDFRKGRADFTKAQLLNYIKRILDDDSSKNFNENTIMSDISVFVRNYLKPTYKETKIDIEEDFSSLMIDLDLMKTYKSENFEGKIVDWYQVENRIQTELPAALVLFAILDNKNYGKSIPFKELLVGYNSPGAIFVLNEEGLYNKIEEIVKEYKGITYTETAGVRELQLKGKLNKWEVLNGCY